ncbi:hypothetical protein HU200_030697 [Digitaria exilis]|uniref:Uncharacterized protein n=1 Tax=Digitaria exilis TaxID=1010633 RepID=A0A835BR64_9POAL|nr:hypothetical protein HU200_030697 [Digitaria exilis]
MVAVCDVAGRRQTHTYVYCTGLEETREACCGLGPFKAVTCGGISTPPTDAVATLLADWSWSPPTAMTTTNICTPVSLQHLVAAHGLT